MKARRQEVEQEALGRAVGSTALSNYPAIISGFVEKGIPEGDIKPRENVFTYHAWRALGRQVRKGEHGVHVLTYVHGKKTTPEGKEEAFSFPKGTTVFHVSQTDPISN